jgi:hypothetical protein
VITHRNHMLLVLEKEEIKTQISRKMHAEHADGDWPEIRRVANCL